MLNLPEIHRKPRKKPYKKSDAIRELERLAIDEARAKHPTMKPEHLAPRKFRDDSANNLTKCIVKYITLRGGFASRVNNQGTFSLKLGKYIPSTSKKGLPDIIGTYKGLSLQIEVKHGKDRQSEAQMKIETEVIRAGGKYFIAKDFSTFKEWFDTL